MPVFEDLLKKLSVAGRNLVQEYDTIEKEIEE